MLSTLPRISFSNHSFFSQYHGWCQEREECANSHCLVRIVTELAKEDNRVQKRNGKKRRAPAAFGIMSTNQVLQAYLKRSKEGCGEETQGHQSNLSNEECRTVTNGNSSTHNLSTNECPTAEDKRTHNSYTNGNNTEIPTHECPTSEDKRIHISYTNGNSSSHNPPLARGSSNTDCEGHSAGYDAFMTGYVFSSYVSFQQSNLQNVSTFSASNISMIDHVNKVYLMSKNIPLTIKSNMYSKVSTNCSRKLLKIHQN